MAVIKSLEDWWAKCNANWENILDIFQRVGAPMGRDEEDRWWPDAFGHPDILHPKCLAQTLEDLRAAQDGQGLHRLMYHAWYRAPKSGTHKWPGYIVFCDLISEDWVFNEASQLDAVAMRHPSEGEAPDDAIWPQAHRTPS